MGGRGQSLVTQQGHAAHRAHAHTGSEPVASLGETDDSPAAPAPAHRHAHAHKHAHGCRGLLSRALPGALLSIVGLDLYTKGRAADGIARARRQNGGGNPFDVGLIANCWSFWTRGRTLGINYTELYEVPEGGFKRALAARRAAGGSADGDVKPSSRTRSGGYAMLPSRAEEV